MALPSIWWDCAPLAAAECLAAGTPLIVPRLGGLPEAICDGIDGLTFDGFDTDDLARQLDRLAIVPGLLERLQAAIEPPRAFADYVESSRPTTPMRPSRVASTPNPTSISVRWQGDHGLATSLSIINDQITSRLAGRSGASVATTPALRSTAAAHRRRRGAPSVAAGPASADRRPAGGDRALGVRRRARDWARRSAPTSTNCGCQANTCGRCTSAAASSPIASSPSPTAST